MGSNRGAALALAGAALLASPAAALDAWGGSLAKEDPALVRVLSYNVFNQYPPGSSDASVPTIAAHRRILQAVQPDILSFQEMDPGIGAALKAELESTLGGTWHVHQGLVTTPTTVNANLVASRWPLSMQRVDTIPSSSVRGVTMALVDLPDATFDRDLYVMGVHFQCCAGATEDARRQRHADAIASWMGDARQPGGNITLPQGTPMLVVGDVNFNNVANPGPRNTLLTGEIADTATFGPWVRPDWDESDNAEALPLDLFTMSFNTFSSATASPTSRLDRFYFTDSAMEAVQGMVVNTLSMTGEALGALGLLASDTATASDHLPVFVDFALPGIAPALPRHGDVFVSEFMPDPTFVPDLDGEWLELFNATDAAIDIDGWILRDSGTNLHVIRREGGLAIGPRSHLVLGINGNSSTNGSVPVDYVFPLAFRVANAGDTIELYRGSAKIDGIRYGTGMEGLAPANRLVPVPPAGASMSMQGRYFDGRIDAWAPATRKYNPADFGTPGFANTGEPSAWRLVE